MKYPLGRIHPHGNGGKSVYQRAARSAKSDDVGSCFTAFLVILLIAFVGWGIWLVITGGGSLAMILFGMAYGCFLSLSES